MNFLVVGVGALGSTYLAFLSRAGHRAVGLLKKGKKSKQNKGGGYMGRV